MKKKSLLSKKTIIIISIHYLLYIQTTNARYEKDIFEFSNERAKHSFFSPLHVHCFESRILLIFPRFKNENEHAIILKTPVLVATAHYPTSQLKK